jgi:WD40 repeat protein
VDPLIREPVQVLTKELARVLAEAPESQDAEPPLAMAVLTALRLAGVQPRQGRVTRVPVLFDKPGNAGGAVGMLEICELTGGPAGLYPDPETMSSIRADKEFTAALINAWSYAIRGRSVNRCVMWRLTLSDDAPVLLVGGRSLGAPLAIALREHLRGQSPRNWPWAAVRAAFLGLRPRCAITGALGPGDTLVGVGGMQAKIEAARTNNWRLVVPKSNQDAAIHVPDGLHVYWASTMRQASRCARRWRPVRTGLAAAAALVLAGTGIAIRLDNAAADNASMQRALNTSIHVAAESETFDTTDPAMAAMLAVAAWRIDHTSQARESLLQAYAQPERATMPDSAPFLAEGVQPVAFSPDGSVLVTATNDEVKLWDAITHRETGAPIPFSSGVCAVSFSPRGKLVAIEGPLGDIRLWDVATRRPASPPMFAGYDRQGGTNCGTAFSPDGNVLAAAGPDGSIRMWNLRTYRQVGMSMPAASGSGLGDLVFNPAGTMLFAASMNGTITAWNIATRAQAGPPIAAPEDRGTVALSPDGKVLATVGNDLRFWSVRTHREIGSPVPIPRAGANMVAFSPTQPVVATANADGTITFWNEITRRQVGPVLPADSSGAADSVTFSPRGGILATTSENETRLWNPSLFSPTGSPLIASTHGAATDVAFSPNGTTLATTGSDGAARLWNPATRRQVGPALTVAAHHALAGVAFSRDGRILALSGGSTRLWNVATRKPVGPPLPGLSADDVQNIGPGALSFSKDGSTLAFISSIDDDTTFTALRLWNTVTRRQIRKPISDGGDVYAVAFSPDGTHLVTGEDGQAAVLWSAPTYRQVGASLKIGSGSGITWSVAFSRDGKTVATAVGDQVQLWDAATQQPEGAVITAGDNGEAAMTFSPDGELLATADGTVKLWDVATHQQIGSPVTSGTGAVSALAFSPDGRLLATADGDGTVQLIDAAFPRNLVSAVCAKAGRNLTPHEWRAYVQSEFYQKICLPEDIGGDS